MNPVIFNNFIFLNWFFTKLDNNKTNTQKKKHGSWINLFLNTKNYSNIINVFYKRKKNYDF
jgi:hypothetical protein